MPKTTKILSINQWTCWNSRRSLQRQNPITWCSLLPSMRPFPPFHLNGHYYSQRTRIFPKRKSHESILSHDSCRIVSLILNLVFRSILASSLDRDWEFSLPRLTPRRSHCPPRRSYYPTLVPKMSSSSAFLETLAATMHLAFPKPLDPSLGTPNHFVLNNLLQYMCKCAQTHKSPISKKMNLLYVAIDPTL